MERRLQIVIAGDGPAREQLERLTVKLGVADRVSFIGFRDDVADLLAACDLVVLPSVREGLSIALLEAMAAGKPIVATSIGSQREVSSHGEVGLFVRPADAICLAEAILRLAGDQALMTRLGNNARSVYENFYTEDRMLQSYRRFYLDLLEAKGSEAAAIDSRRHRGLLERQPEVLNQSYPALVSSHQLKGDRV
jgi:glycosyltransferase involved in cell wall biosynthesis